MRMFLLASAAMLSATTGGAFAQLSPGMTESAYSGMLPNIPTSAAGANNNNNVQAQALKGPTANPTPGTFVVRLGGRVNVEAGSAWSNVDSVYIPGTPASGGVTTTKTYALGTGVTLPAGNTNVITIGPGGTTVATTTPKVAATAPTGAKRNPYGIGTYMRLYPGLDAMATNGLRYGAGTEIRTNWGTNTTGGSGATSGETLMVRRAFVYAAGDNWGLVRFGQGDGVISLFDGGVTTSQNWSNSGVLNGGDLSALPPSRTAVPFYWMAVAGNEYGSNKIVYISPKLFGVEAGFSYAPSPSNAYADGGTSPYNLTAICPVASSNCASLSSSSVAADAGRYTDLYQVGLRYLNDIGPVNVRAYGVYVGSGQVSYTGAAPTGRSVAGYYDNLSVYNAGIAGTFAGFTLGANWIGGAMNGQFALKPAGGANLNATTVGLQYVTGALTLGVTGAVATSQGSAALVGQTQLAEQEISFGGRYVVAPGLAVSADYLYQQRKQNGFNWVTNAAGEGKPQVQAQGVLLGVAVNW